MLKDQREGERWRAYMHERANEPSKADKSHCTQKHVQTKISHHLHAFFSSTSPFLTPTFSLSLPYNASLFLLIPPLSFLITACVCVPYVNPFTNN